MLRRVPTILTTALLAAAIAAPASAQLRDPVDVFVSGKIHVGTSAFLRVGQTGSSTDDARIDYAVFAHELVAYIAKEVFPDADDEYVGSSEIPSRLSGDVFPKPRSKFGEHCLIVLAEVGSHISPFPSGGDLDRQSPNFLSWAARAGTTVLALRQVWSAFRNDVEDRRSGFSLNPKVGSKKVGMYLTFRW